MTARRRNLRGTVNVRCDECGAKYEWAWNSSYPAANERLQELAIEQHAKAHEQFKNQEGTKQ